KHNGQLHRIWEESLVLKGTENVIIVANDKTMVTESDGENWITQEPAICYFYADCWFNIISMIKNDGIHYYCNISSPFVYDENMIKYIDYDLDVMVYPDMTHVLLDKDEYEENKQEIGYPDVLDRILYRNVEYLLGWVRQRKGPFSAVHIDQWYERF